MKHSALQLAARLCRALRGQDDAMVAALLWEGADPNLVLPEGVAPMHLAAGLEQQNGIRRLRLLLQHGGDPNARSAEGLTPLHVAASWGCTACLRLLLTEGGDPHLEDQDGNTAFDLAVEQGNETCVNILQDGGWNSGFPQRRAESFLTTIMEDAGQAGPGDSLSYPSDRLSLSSLKEARQYTGPPGNFPQPGGAAPNGAPGPCTQDRSASSFLTECSWQGDTILDLSELTIRTADSPDAFLPPRKLASSCADVQTCWDSQVGRSPSDAGVKQSWDIWASAEEGCSSPPGPDTTLGGPLSLVGSEALSFRPDMVRAAESPQKTLPSASLRSKPEAARLHPPRDANPCGLSQVCVSLDPGLSVRLPSQDGLDITCLDHLAESTAVSDLGKTVAGPASVLGVSGTLDGCLAGGRSLGRCSATSTDRYLSCISECYASAVEGPGYGYVHGWEGGKAAPSGPAGGCNTSNEGSCCGPPACMGTGLHGQRTLPTRGAARIFPGSQDLALPHSKSTWEVSQRRERSMIGPPENEAPWEGSAWGTQGPTETRGLPVGRQGSALSGAREEMAEAGMTGPRPRLALPTSPRQAGEGQPSSPTQDTIPVQWTLEGRNCFRGCGGPLGPSSTVGGTEVAPGPLASIGEEPLSTLDAQLRSLMLATRVAHSPLLPSNRKCSPAPPWPQRPLVGALPQQSLSTASLFEEPLEMPRRPRRVRRAPGPASTQRAAGLGCSPPPAREAEEVGEGTAVSAVPSCRKTPSNPGPGSWGCFLASSRGDVGRGEESAAGKPSAGDTAQGYPEVGHLESLGARGSLGKRAEKTSRVSFSRLSGRGPSATSPPGRLSPIRQEVPLSPGGRPANLSATEPVEYLYVDEEKGQSLIERHLPPTDDSGASTSEDTLVYDWRACARAAAGRQGNGECAPLNPEYLTDKALIRKLRELGANPGPVTPLTRRLYVRLLERLSRDPETPTRKGSAVYSPELASALDTYRIPTSKADEGALAAEFDRPDKSRRWREGLLKSSFNYLLLDPRVTQNLPARCQLLSPAEAFQTFVRAIFYVGKGTRGRPYRHLYEALTHYREGQGTPAGPQVSSKVQHILEIWAGGRGVVSMHCFQNVVPVEAYTREACMVDAIGLKMLTNQKKGNYYGLVAGWPMKRRRSLGVFLLHRALQIFLAEGERQLRPADI